MGASGRIFHYTGINFVRSYIWWSQFENPSIRLGISALGTDALKELGGGEYKT
jgi:hypothetical protein